MKVIYNNIIPFKGFLAINLFGVLFVRGTWKDINARVLNHEKIHTAQMKELGYIFFYLLYVMEWFFRLCTGCKNAYREISFEREAYDNERYDEYLQVRQPFAMWRQR